MFSLISLDLDSYPDFQTVGGRSDIQKTYVQKNQLYNIIILSTKARGRRVQGDGVQGGVRARVGGVAGAGASAEGGGWGVVRNKQRLQLGTSHHTKYQTDNPRAIKHHFFLQFRSAYQ